MAPFMVFVDVPMYYHRALANLAAGRMCLGFWQAQGGAGAPQRDPFTSSFHGSQRMRWVTAP